MRALVLFVASLAAVSAHAHKLNLFATATDHEVVGKVYFPTGPAPGLTVELRNSAGSVVSTARSSEDGSFTFAGPPPPPYTLVSQTVDGHRAEFRIDAEDTMEQAAPVKTDVQTPEDNALNAAIRAAVQHEIQPLREQLDREANRVRVRDIAGGFGYIFGISGLIMLFKRRAGGPS